MNPRRNGKNESCLTDETNSVASAGEGNHRAGFEKSGVPSVAEAMEGRRATRSPNGWLLAEGDGEDGEVCGGDSGDAGGLADGGWSDGGEVVTGFGFEA